MKLYLADDIYDFQSRARPLSQLLYCLLAKFEAAPVLPLIGSLPHRFRSSSFDFRFRGLYRLFVFRKERYEENPRIFSCNLNRRKRWNEAKLDGKPFNSLNLSLNISNSFSKFVSVNFRWRGDRKKVERPFHRFGNGVCVQSLSYLAEPPSIRDCHPGYEQL